nr:DUF87 domain-containing protein [Candidatus Njordarchaeota archaeon]
MIAALDLGAKRRLGWKWKLLFFLVVFVVFLFLFARIPFVGGGVQRVLMSMLSMVQALLFGLAPVIVGVALFAAALSLIRRRGGRRWVAERLFSSCRRCHVVTLAPSTTRDTLLINFEKEGKRGGKEWFIMSALKLLSVPSEGVRQRVRGAVSEEESEESAVSDEKQYQFSHLASLHEKERGNDLRSYELHFKKGLVNVMFTVSGSSSQECRSRREQVRASILSKFPIQLTEEKSGEQLKEAALLGLLTRNNSVGNIGDEEEEELFLEGEELDSHVDLRGCGAEMVVVNVETVNDNVARVEMRGGWVTRRQPPRYVSVVVLKGRPEMSAHEQKSQIDHLIAGINSLTGRGNSHLDAERRRRRRIEEEAGDEDIVFTVSFQNSTPPKYPSDASLREKLREKPEVELSLERKRVEVDAMEVEFGRRVGWWKVSAYAVVAGRNAAEVEEKAKMVMRVIRGVWSGSHFSPDCVFLHSKEVVKNFNQILRRSLMKRYVTEMSSVRLSSLVHLPEEPHPPLTRATPPLFEAPDPKTLSNYGNAADSSNSLVEFGEVQGVSGGGLYQLALPLNSLGKHMSVFGEPGSGKTCLIINLLRQVQQQELTVGVSFLVLDQKGEYRSLVPSLKDQGALRVIYFMPASRLAPLKINLFDPQGDRPETHVKQLFSIIREVLFASGRTELSPQMERVFYDVLELNVGGDWSTFREKLDRYVKAHGAEMPQLDATVQAIMNRVGSFTRPPLSYVFNCKESNVNFGYLTERNVVIDLSELRRHGAPEDVRLVANVIAKYVSSASLSRGASHGSVLRHLFVVDDALDVVPEILAKKTTAEVGLIEFMTMLLRATGQGLIVVSQRPNVSRNVIGNSDIKVFFRTVVDARDVAAWLNLNEEQTAYLRVLPPREAIIAAPTHPTPLRVKTLDIDKVVRRKVSDEDIIINNMINYPRMYDGNPDGRVDYLQEEMEAGDENETDTLGGEVGKEQEEEDAQEKDVAAEVPQLDSEAKEAWIKLGGSLVGGGWSALDSEFVSAKLGVPPRSAHRAMLSLRKAGLVGCVKVPNYAYGKGTQYVYYYAPWEDEERRKGVYGSGVIGYVRQRIHGDLTAREVVVQLSPHGVPSADMIIQDAFPLVIHLATERDLRLPTLRHRIREVVDEFNRCTGSNLLDAGAGVIVLTLWGSTAKLINQRRDEEIERGTADSYLLCAIPFSRHWVNLLADYALHHITLRTFLMGGVEEQEDGEQKGEVKGNGVTLVNDYIEEGEVVEGEQQETARKVEQAGGEEEALKQGDRRERERKEAVKGEVVREKVLSIVRELSGVEPHIVAERLGVPLWRISKVAGELKEEGSIKILNSLPYLTSLSKANATYYLDAGRPTALHDTLMNMVWARNIALGGRCRDYSFEYGGKTWHTDGLLENVGACVLLEAVSGDCEERVIQQVQAYSAQVGYMGIKGVIVVFLSRGCLEKVRSEVASRGISLGEAGLLTTLRSRDEKLQFENLLLRGKPAGYHRNTTAGS